MKNAQRALVIALSLLGGLALAAVPARAQSIRVSIGKVEGAPGSEVEVLISVKGAKDVPKFAGLGVKLGFDPALLSYKSYGRGPLLHGDALLTKIPTDKWEEGDDPGVLTVGFACVGQQGSKKIDTVDADGPVMKIVFTVRDDAAAGKKCPLQILAAEAASNDRDAPPVGVIPEDGEFTVTGAGLPWLWILIAIGAALLLLLLLILLLGRRKHEQQPAMAYQGYPAQPMPVYPPAGGSFQHRCVKCGGVLTLPANMAGHQFQCSGCGTVQVAGS